MSVKIKVGRSILETISVALYENPIILFREYVQNSLDAYNESIDENRTLKLTNFHVNIDIDQPLRRITIKDNGYGIKTYSKFEDKMLSIGASNKSLDRTKYIGFRGIGRISGLAFCNKLTFRNKALGQKKIHECVWDGQKYRDLLDSDTPDEGLPEMIEKIVMSNEVELGEFDVSDHFFEVILEGYTDDIQGLIEGEGSEREEKRFDEKLIRMLPLKYKKDFKGAEIIAAKYKAFMEDDLSRFMISVKLNGIDLYKGYDDSYILQSDIVFWEIRGKKKKTGEPGDKMGLLWFTFDAHMLNLKNNQYYGILTRSKNVLMGTNDTFAQVADGNKQYVTTFREMVQTLQSVYGELLINSYLLSDNARRDWFLPDQNSLNLSNAITDFMKRLYKYRYCSSRYFRSNSTKSKEDLKEVLQELVDIKSHKINYSQFYKRSSNETTVKESNHNEDLNSIYADEDIPNESETLQKYYNKLMKVIEDFMKKEKKRNLFLKLRAFISNYFRNAND